MKELLDVDAFHEMNSKMLKWRPDSATLEAKQGWCG
jgi:hypothetical protein